MIALPKGSNPIDIAEADLDGDQQDDYIVLNRGSGTVAVFLSSAAGAPPVMSTVGASPAAIAVIPGSSPVRLAVARPSAGDLNRGTLEIFTWDGTSQFVSQQLLNPTGVNPSAVAVADLNGDGQPDLVVLNPDAGSVSVFLADGNGGFRQTTDFAVGDSPSAMTLADLNNDGVPDLAVTGTSGSLSILLGDRTGGFGAPTSFDSVQGAAAIVAADFNADGNLDLAIASPDLDLVAFLAGDGSGSFTDAGKYHPGGSKPLSLAVVDLDGDAIPDLVTANNGSQDLSILLIENPTPGEARKRRR